MEFVFPIFAVLGFAVTLQLCGVIFAIRYFLITLGCLLAIFLNITTDIPFWLCIAIGLTGEALFEVWLNWPRYRTGK